MTPHQTFADIKGVILRMIQAGLADEQKYPEIINRGNHEMEINISGAPDLSASMKKANYVDIYNELLVAKAFNIKLIDGALIQMCYTFKKNAVTSHRLAFFPSPMLQSYEDAQSLYEGDEIFADVVDQYFVRFPIRFDFSASDKEYVDGEHPKSHLTLGQYKNCRIPVDGPITPTRFMKFLSKNFYNSADGLVKYDAKIVAQKFAGTISDKERKMAHVVM